MSDTELPFQRVGVLGLGVMGGSLARALGALPLRPTVVGWSPDASEVADAVAAGALDEGAAGPEAAAEAVDLVVLAAPVDACVTLMGQVVPHLHGETLLTDLASLKAPLARAATELGLEGRWVGCHPMCGSAGSGFQASRADLFADARIWLCAHEEARVHLPSIRRFWVSLGAVTAPTEALAHDALMAWVSHLPQLTANALADALEAAGVTPDDLGPGARDMTRLAESSPDVWRDILAHAPAELPDHLRGTADRLRALASLVEEGDMEALMLWMTASRAWKRRR